MELEGYPQIHSPSGCKEQSITETHNQPSINSNFDCDRIGGFLSAYDNKEYRGLKILSQQIIVKKKRGWPKGKPRLYLRKKFTPGSPSKEAKIQQSLSRFEQFLNIIRGKADVKSRLMLLLNPDKVETSTRLSRSEVDFVSLSLFVAREFPEFEPLKDFAMDFCLANISLQGLGREEAIRFTSALSESKILERMGFFRTEETKASSGKV